MKLNRARIIAAITVTLTFGSMPVATAEDDPFPGVAYQAEIPGTRVSGDIAFNCPAGSGRGIEVAIGSGTFTYCIKTWQSPATIDAWATYRSSVDSAQAAALAQSQQWNEANPGKQKCFQWGPITDPNGGTSSGGVCANPVPVPASSVVDSGTVVSAPAPVQESATVNSAPVVTTSAPIATTGLGGYAVVHPDGHVCGVIVGTSADPFGNGGTMPQEYMGCPAGARIVFQSTPSADGNVAGWHGQDVVLSGNTYTLPGGSTLSGGVVTDTNGRTWNSGTGVTITPGVVDTRTVVSDTTTVLVDTPTVLSSDSLTVLAAPIAIAPLAASVVDTATVVDDLDALPEILAEEEPSTSIEARIVAGKTRISIVSDFVATKMTVVASKKGSRKKYTYRISTNSNGELIFKSSVNLKGFTLVIYKDGEELDREVV